jgi:NAD(P)-dependent dehydrogenase (short-subunit alcohol dehydrogenase family)
MKNTVIIGAGKGIGFASAQILNNNNHQVFAFTRNLTEDLASLNISSKEFDSNDFESSAFNHLPEIIDNLIFCPGSILLKPFHRISIDEFQADFNQNVLGAIKVVQALLPRLKKSEAASIVLFSTVAVQTGMTFHSSVSASKGAIEGLTRSLAAEFSPSIRVNCIAPSLVETSLSEKLTSTPEKIENAAQRHPLKKIGKVEDLAAMVKFLAEDSSSWITGQVLAVDGGMGVLK